MDVLAWLGGFILLTASGLVVIVVKAYVDRRWGDGAEAAQLSYIKSLEGSLHLAQEEAARFSTDLAQVRSDLGQLRSEVAQLRAELTEARRESDRLRAENVALNLEKVRLLARIAELTGTAAPPVKEPAT